MHRFVSPPGVFALVSLAGVFAVVVALVLRSSVAAGALDDGADLLPQAGISIDAAVGAAQGAASGAVGEVDLEYLGDRLVFNVEVGPNDVKVDAAAGAVLSVDA